ncbi:amidohydrolase family protein [candidate division CSSED10-310 bacterium]|uniref:Amidohydrolase family protein n=1 Tax=candidate division CSSED10-310 bacterium TaxID=2855610 RepID=A0ABV6YXJ4_UNCC1
MSAIDMIIDTHTHIYQRGSGGPFNLPATVDDLVRQMDQHDVDMSVVIPLPGVASNLFVSGECERFPDRLSYLYTPELDEPRETILKMQRFFEEYSARGIKIHPRLQGVSVNDTLVEEILDFALTQKYPVVFDVFPFGPDFSDPRQQPAMYNYLAQKMPTLTIILAHAGGYKIMEAFLTAKANLNIVLEISITPSYFSGSSVTEDLKFVCQRLPEGRIMYGSDYPEVTMAESLKQARIITKNLNKNKLSALYSETAKRIFKLN